MYILYIYIYICPPPPLHSHVGTYAVAYVGAVPDIPNKRKT